MNVKKAINPKCVFRAYVVLLVIVKMILTAGIRVWATVDSPYDDGMMIQDATNLINHKWLGNFNQYTLAKGIAYPLYVSVMSKFGVPLLLSIVLLSFAACLTFTLVMRKLISNRLLLALLYTVLMFNPMSTYFWTFNRVYRDSVYSYFVIFLFAFLIAIFLNRFGSLRKTVLLGIGSGLSLAAVWLAREDSPWVAPFVAVALLITVAGILLHKDLQHKIKRLLALAVTPVILAIAVLGVSFINDRFYGVFLTNEFTGGALPSLIKELQSIKPDTWSPHVPIPKSTREKAYSVSPTFAKVEPYLENHGFVVQAGGNPTCDLFVWAMVDSVQQSGITDGRSSQEFYQKSAQEIHKAAQNGQLKTRGGFISVFLSPWDSRYIRPFLVSLKSSVRMTVLFQDYNGQMLQTTNSVSSGSESQIRQLEQITGNLAFYKNEDIPNRQGKINFLNAITSVYAKCNPVLIIAGLLGYLYLSFRFLLNRRAKKSVLFEEWVILTGLWLSCLLRLILISYSNASCNFVLYPMYLAPAYWLMTMASFSGLLITCTDIFKRYRLVKTLKTSDQDIH